MTLVNEMVFFIIFLIIYTCLNDGFSLLVFGVFMADVTIHYGTFFTETMTPQIADVFLGLNALLTALCFVKIYYIYAKKKNASIEV